MKNNKVNYATNYLTIYFNTNIERKGKAKFCQSVINAGANILSQKLIKYMKKGGDINNLTPDNAFKSNQ